MQCSRWVIAVRSPEGFLVPNELLFAGTGGAGVRGVYDLEYGMRASATEEGGAERSGGTVQESRMSTQRIERNADWHERVAALLRGAPRVHVTPPLGWRRRNSDTR